MLSAAQSSFLAWLSANPLESGQASTEANAKNSMARLATKATQAMILSGPLSTSSSSSAMEVVRIGALEIAAVGEAEGSFIVARGSGWVALPPAAGVAGAPAGRAKAGVAGRGGVAPRGIVLLPTGETGGAGRGGAPGAVGALGAGGAPPMEGRGGGLSGTVGAGGPPMDGAPGAGRGVNGTVAGGASAPGALARRVMRTVSFFRGTADVLVDGIGVGVGAFSSWLIGKIDFLGEFPPINGSSDGGCQLFEGKLRRNP